MLPDVAAIMLCNGRSEMVRRATRSFDSQSYDNKRLIVWENNGDRSIGRLRNDATAAAGNADIIVHFDSDDVSHPNRIAEQVALLQSSGAECVGYNEMLFWREARHNRKEIFADGPRTFTPSGITPEAWLYRAAIPNYAIGTSMCYWRSTWLRHSFPDRSEGCDDLEWFNKGVRTTSVSAAPIVTTGVRIMVAQPTMIASIHGGNTCAKIDAQAREWTRVREWDAYCRANMAL